MSYANDKSLSSEALFESPPPAERRIEALLIDAGGVLLLPDPVALRARLSDLGHAPDDARCHEAFYSGVRELDRTGLRDWRSVDHVVASAVGVGREDLGVAAKAIADSYGNAPWTAAPGAVEGLRLLEATDLKVAVVSNSDGTMEEQLAAGSICSVLSDHLPTVAAVFDSATIGASKPQPEIFHHAAAELGVESDRCAHVGDSIEFDVTGAAAANVAPVHFDPFGFCGSYDHPHARSLGDLASLLANRSR